MSERNAKPPELSPYVFPALLALFGLWCFYDGWLNANPSMAEHLIFNRVLSVLLLPWALIDFLRTRRREAAVSKEDVEDDTPPLRSERD